MTDEQINKKNALKKVILQNFKASAEAFLMHKFYEYETPPEKMGVVKAAQKLGYDELALNLMANI